MKSWKELPIGGIVIKAGSSQENKTGSWSRKKPTIDQSQCIRCQQCIRVCPESSIHADNEKKIDIDLDYCKGCGICAEVCPKKAIKLS